MQKSTVSAVAREAIVAVFSGILDDAAIASELQRRKNELGTSTEAEQ